MSFYSYIVLYFLISSNVKLRLKLEFLTDIVVNMMSFTNALESNIKYVVENILTN